MEDILKTLVEQKVLELRNGSAELFFDDVGILQEIVFRTKRRRRTGELLNVKGLTTGTALADYKDGIIEQVRYETKWRRPRVVQNT